MKKQLLGMLLAVGAICADDKYTNTVAILTAQGEYANFFPLDKDVVNGLAELLKDEESLKALHLIINDIKVTSENAVVKAAQDIRVSCSNEARASKKHSVFDEKNSDHKVAVAALGQAEYLRGIHPSLQQLTVSKNDQSLIMKIARNQVSNTKSALPNDVAWLRKNCSTEARDAYKAIPSSLKK